MSPWLTIAGIMASHSTILYAILTAYYTIGCLVYHQIMVVSEKQEMDFGKLYKFLLKIINGMFG